MEIIWDLPFRVSNFLTFSLSLSFINNGNFKYIEIFENRKFDIYVYCLQIMGMVGTQQKISRLSVTTDIYG